MATRGSPRPAILYIYTPSLEIQPLCSKRVKPGESRTVRLRQTGLSAIQNQRLEMQLMRVRVDRYCVSRTVRAIGADHLPFKLSVTQRWRCFWTSWESSGGPFAAPWRTVLPSNDEAHQKRNGSVHVSELGGGPSAPPGQTVCPSFVGATQKHKSFCQNLKVRGGPSASQGQPVCLTFHSAKT